MIEILGFKLKKSFFLYHYNLVLQDEIFCIAYQLFFLLFYIQDKT